MIAAIFCITTIFYEMSKHTLLYSFSLRGIIFQFSQTRFKEMTCETCYTHYLRISFKLQIYPKLLIYRYNLLFLIINQKVMQQVNYSRYTTPQIFIYSVSKISIYSVFRIKISPAIHPRITCRKCTNITNLVEP